MLQDTKNLISTLVKLNTKMDFQTTINNELKDVIHYFYIKGHNLTFKDGFIGRQILNDNDLFLYMYFRDLHFIYWGFKGNWQTFDKIDILYYPNLKIIVEGIYNNLH